MASLLGPKMRKLGILERPLDIVVIVLLCYFLFSCWCIEVKYCADGLGATDTRFMMPETYAFAKDHNPYFLSGPRWLRVATCGSAYCFSCGYLMMAVGYLLGVNSIRVPTIMFIGAKVYALATASILNFFHINGVHNDNS